MWYMCAILVFRLRECWIGKAIWGIKIYMINILFWSLYFFFFKWNMKRIYRNCQNGREFFDVLFGGSIAGSMFFISNAPIFIKLESIFLFLYFKSPFFRYNIKQSILGGREISLKIVGCVIDAYLWNIFSIKYGKTNRNWMQFMSF